MGIGESSIMRCTTGTPKVRFGTKWLSITSRWAASALAMEASSDSILPKSADSKEGWMCTVSAYFFLSAAINMASVPCRCVQS